MLQPLAPRAPVGHALPMPDPEVRERPIRRRFTAEYKRRIVEEANAAAEPGAVGALLRREGLYSSPWGSETPIRSRREPVVLVDEATEQVPAANIARADRHWIPGFCERCGESEGAMGPLAVVVRGVGPEGAIEVAPTEAE